LNPAINLEQLRVVHIRSKVLFDGIDIGLGPVRRNLASPIGVNPIAKVADKLESTHPIPLTDMMGQNQFGFTVQAKKRVGIAPLAGIVDSQVRLPGMDEAIEFISLNESGSQIAYVSIQNSLAFIPNGKQERKNRGFVNARKPGDSADTHALGKHRNNLNRFARVNRVPSKQTFAGFGESSSARITAKTLNPQSSIRSESLCRAVIASQAGHVGSPLENALEKPDNEGLGFKCGFRPRLNLLPPYSVRAEYGGLSNYSLGGDLLISIAFLLTSGQRVSTLAGFASTANSFVFLFLSGPFRISGSRYPFRSDVRRINLCEYSFKTTDPSKRFLATGFIEILYFSVGFQSINRVVNRWQFVFIAIHMKSGLFEFVPHIGRGQRIRGSGLKSKTDGIAQPYVS
jgi:hypothetical protein